MKELIKKKTPDKKRLINEAIIQRYFPSWANIPGLTKNFHL